MEERPQIWRVAVNILNKQSRTADKGWSYNLGVGRGAETAHRDKVSGCESFTKKTSNLD